MMKDKDEKMNSIFTCPEIELAKKTVRINPNIGNGDVQTNDHDDNDFNDNQNPVYILGDLVHVRLITNNEHQGLCHVHHFS